jgi:uncharacterized protein YozE (UPF0346 family)
LGQLGLMIKVMEADGKKHLIFSSDHIINACIYRPQGNCLFRALSDQVTGTNKQHFEIRRQIIDYIESHKEHYSLFIEDDEPFDDYISRMRTTGEWGGHQELHAASQCLQINIYVHQVDAPRYILTCKDASMDIHLSYHGECHYNSVRSKKDPDNGDKPIPIDVEEIKKIILEKEAIEAEKVKKEAVSNNAKTDAPDDTSFVLAGWVAPDIVQFVKDSYDAFEDVYEEALEMASSLTGVEAPTPAVINGKVVPARSRSVSRREARKAQQEQPKPASLSKKVSLCRPRRPLSFQGSLSHRRLRLLNCRKLGKLLRSKLIKKKIKKLKEHQLHEPFLLASRYEFLFDHRLPNSRSQATNFAILAGETDGRVLVMALMKSSNKISGTSSCPRNRFCCISCGDISDMRRLNGIIEASRQSTWISAPE